MSEEPTPPPKVDPETLVLRGTPRRAIRFKRWLIAALAGGSALTLSGLAWFALKPPSFRIAAIEEQPEPVAKPPADALANAPADYQAVPQLGPPLPGDLGRAILAHQRAEGTTATGNGSDALAQQQAQAAETERQRIEADRKAARESGLLVQVTAVREASKLQLADSENDGTVPAVEQEANPDPNAQRHKLAFASESKADAEINPHPLVPPLSPYTLSAGSIIAASLITGLDSDLPGMVTAQVTENAWDSATGRILLIPQGSRLIGRYDSVVSFGQKRALVVWTRLVFPDGSSLQIDNAPATDTEGYAGLSDRIDRHGWQLLKGVGLSTLLGVGTQLGFGSADSDLIRAIRESAQQNAARASDQITMKNLDVQPTLKVRPGWPLRVVVHKDLIFPKPWRPS